MDVGGTPVISTGNDMGGSSWLFALLLIALLGGNGGGLFGGGNSANADSRFTAIENQIAEGNLTDSIRYTAETNRDAVAGISTQIGQVESRIATNSLEANFNARLAEIQAQATSSNQHNAVMGELCKISTATNEAAYGALKNSYETNMHIDEATNRILAAMQQNEVQNLRDKLLETQMGLNNANQSSALLTAIRPYPTPSFVVGNPQQSFFPPQPSVMAQAAYGYPTVTAGA